MTKQEALEAIIDICEEAWHVRGSDSRLAEIRGIARAALNASEPRTLETVTGERVDLAQPWRVPNDQG